jgi:hypothetical protein
MGKRTGGKRGAPLGNRNRLKHGNYSARRIARRAEVNALLRRARNLIRRIEMMAWARKALRAKKARKAFHLPLCGEVDARSGASTSGGGRYQRVQRTPTRNASHFDLPTRGR